MLIWTRDHRTSEKDKVTVGQDKWNKLPGGSGNGAGLSGWAVKKGQNTLEHGADIASTEGCLILT